MKNLESTEIDSVAGGESFGGWVWKKLGPVGKVLAVVEIAKAVALSPEQLADIGEHEAGRRPGAGG